MKPGPACATAQFASLESRGSHAMVAVDMAAKTSAAVAPVHSPAMAPCAAREPAGTEPA